MPERVRERAKPRLKAFRPKEAEKVHEATLEVLNRTGVKVTHPRALKLLADGGAKIKESRVRIPPAMVESALASAPSRIALAKRGGERAVVLQSNKSWMGPSLDCLDFLDPITSKRRRFALEDCRTTATLLDGLPNYSWGMTFGLADDVPSELADRAVMKEAMVHCEKPMVFCCNDTKSLKDIYDMAVLIAGSEAKFAKAPTVVMLADPISPLVHSDEVLEKVVFCAEHGIPHIYFGAPQAGSTGPATFAGTIVQGIAESLSGLVISQLLRPGAPFIFGALATIMDMRTMVFSYGAPEMSLMASAMAQMAQYYKLPSFGTAGCSDAKLPDAQAAAEATFSLQASIFSGANLVHDCGLLDHGSLVSPACMVLVHEIISMINQYVRGIRIDEESLAVDVIDRIGPGGQFLTDEHTYDHFADVWYSNLFERSNYQKWLTEGGRKFEERLHQITAEATEHEPTPLPEELIGELDRLAAHWK
jgi:trimethylamine--corrinoid protein Co-methyltransferase